MRKLTFEETFGFAVLILSVAFLVLPFFTGEDANDAKNRLAWIGATAVGLFVLYKLATLRKPPSE